MSEKDGVGKKVVGKLLEKMYKSIIKGQWIGRRMVCERMTMIYDGLMSYDVLPFNKCLLFAMLLIKRIEFAMYA